MQTVVAGVTGGLSAPYAVSYGLVGNVVLGSGVSVVNAEFGNLYYQGDSTYKQKDLGDLGWEAIKGGFAGGIGYRIGYNATDLLTKPINPNISILFQNYNNPYPAVAGNTISAIVSGPVPIALDKAKEYYLPQDKNK